MTECQGCGVGVIKVNFEVLAQITNSDGTKEAGLPAPFTNPSTGEPITICELFSPSGAVVPYRKTLDYHSINVKMIDGACKQNPNNPTECIEDGSCRAAVSFLFLPSSDLFGLVFRDPDTQMWVPFATNAEGLLEASFILEPGCGHTILLASLTINGFCEEGLLEGAASIPVQFECTSCCAEGGDGAGE